jgi:hypothetical protein
MRSFPAIVATLVALAGAQPAQPSPLPLEFVAIFNELFVIDGKEYPSTGMWTYAFDLGLWRTDHLKPQMNNFCACADNTTDADCSLIFNPDGMYATFTLNPWACCRVCGPEDGCSPLIPSWISANSARAFVGTEVIHKRTCEAWCVPGVDAVADCWLFEPQPDGSQTPCRYSETFSFDALTASTLPAGHLHDGTAVVHNLTFVDYKVRKQPAAAFHVPKDCRNVTCPRTFPTTCG